MSKQWIAENRQKLQDGDESSDSDDLYEDPKSNANTHAEENGEEVQKQQVYCIEFRKAKGSLADYLEFYRTFRHECLKLNNAESWNANFMESQSGNY